MLVANIDFPLSSISLEVIDIYYSVVYISFAAFGQILLFMHLNDSSIFCGYAGGRMLTVSLGCRFR